MPDESHLDEKYFIDRYKYNCPFCNRRHVAYRLSDRVEFDWSADKTCWAYFVDCRSCGHTSMHLTYKDLGYKTSGRQRRFFDSVEDIDQHIFYSQPTSFFTLDSRIPKVIRELFTEAEQCLHSNLLTGGSACARKIVYEMTELAEGAEGDNYEDRIKALKQVYSDVEPTYFDTLLTIQQVTSDKVHEDAYDGWEAEHLRLILATLREILQEVYVEPERRKERRQEIVEFKEKVLGDQQGEEDQ